MPMRVMIIALIILLQSGCILSRDHHLQLVDDHASSKDSACGYWSNAITFGAENQFIISDGDFRVEICATEYESRRIAMGFIIPIFPLIDGYEFKSEHRWVRLSNHSNGPISLAGETIISFSKSRYPDIRPPTPFSEFQILNEEEYIWLSFSKQDTHKLDIIFNENKTSITLRAATSYDWFMVTH